MKQVFALVAAVFALNAFAAEPAKKDEKKADAKPAATAPAPAKDAKAATKSDKPAAQKDTKAEAPKK